MIRIYCDTNVFSNIEFPAKPEHEKLRALFDRNKHNFSFFYSLAHVQDKEKATKKDDSFIFMEQYVKDNLIHHYDDKEDTSFYIATPTTLNADYGGKIDPMSFFKPVDEDDDEGTAIAKRLFQSTLSLINFPVDESLQLSITEETRSLLSKMVPIKNNQINLLDLMTTIAAFHNEVIADKFVYKELRAFLIDAFNKGKLQSENGDIGFNEAFRDTDFKKTFIDYVVDITKQYQKKDKYTFYDYYLQAYTALDMFGISIEEISKKKKNGFNNMVHDSFHSYYASYCDILITDDIGLKAKSSLLYNLYGCRTTIITIHDAITILEGIEKDEEQDAADFFERVNVGIKSPERFNTGIMFNDAAEIVHIVPQLLYLNYFNAILFLPFAIDSYQLIFIKHSPIPLSGASYRETGTVVNKCVKLFGPDQNGKDIFDKDTEDNEMRKGIWLGREWNFHNLTIYIKKDPLFDNELTLGIKSI
jgi:hypothetical protein